MAVETPHFDLPFRMSATGKDFVTVEQDSPEEIVNCVEAIVRYPRGWREDLPEFGVTSLLWESAEVDTAKVRAEIEEWEPRATVHVTAGRDLVDEGIQRVRAEVGTEAVTDG